MAKSFLGSSIKPFHVGTEISKQVFLQVSFQPLGAASHATNGPSTFLQLGSVPQRFHHNLWLVDPIICPKLPDTPQTLPYLCHCKSQLLELLTHTKSNWLLKEVECRQRTVIMNFCFKASHSHPMATANQETGGF